MAADDVRMGKVKVLSLVSMGAAKDLARVLALSVMTTLAGSGHQELPKPSWQAPGIHVVIVLGRECPISNKLTPEYRRLHREFAPKGVSFTGVYAEPGISDTQAQAHAKEWAIPFPILADGDLRVAASLAARVTPEAFVFSNGRIAYQGRINDSYAAVGKTKSRTIRRDVREVLLELGQGKVYKKPRKTEAPGCLIQYPER